MRVAHLLAACLLMPVFAAPAVDQGVPHQMSNTHSKPDIPTLPGNSLGEIRSLDVYVDNQGNIQLLLAISPGGNNQPAVYFTRTEDEGLSWSIPAIVLADQGLPTESKRGNDLQVAASDKNVVAVWQTTGEYPGNGVLVSAWSSDGGIQWQAGPSPSDDNGPSDHGYMDLLADDRGHFHLVWFDDREENGNYNGLRYTRSFDSGRQWQRNVTLDNETCTCCWGKIVASSGHELNLLYRDAEPRDMALMRSEDSGVHWKRMGPVGEFHWEFNGCPHTGGGLAVASQQGQEILHSVVWTGSENARGLHYLRSGDHGVSWMSSRLGDEHAQHADVAVHEDQMVAVWDAAGPNGSAIFVARASNSGQTWTEARQLTGPGVSGSYPRVVAIPSGFLIMWTERKDNAPQRLAMAKVNVEPEPLDNNTTLLNNNVKDQR